MTARRRYSFDDRLLLHRNISSMIEFLIAFLDKLDGDPNFEHDPLEDQHDNEADLTWSGDRVPPFYIVAERARRRAKGH